MAMMTGVKMTAELRGMDDDMKSLEKDFAAALNSAMQVELTAEMEKSLETHVQEDVYDKYEPSVYIRRYEDGGIIDMGLNQHFTYGDGTIEMTYDPSGSIDHLPPGRYPEPIHGDMLISRIERKHPPYNWGGTQYYIPPRPFFSNFVDEMIEGNRAEEAIIRGIQRADPTMDVVADGMIGRDGTEGYEVFTGDYSFGFVKIT